MFDNSMNENILLSPYRRIVPSLFDNVDEDKEAKVGEYFQFKFNIKWRYK